MKFIFFKLPTLGLGLVHFKKRKTTQLSAYFTIRLADSWKSSDIRVRYPNRKKPNKIQLRKIENFRHDPRSLENFENRRHETRRLFLALINLCKIPDIFCGCAQADPKEHTYFWHSFIQMKDIELR